MTTKKFKMNEWMKEVQNEHNETENDHKQVQNKHKETDSLGVLLLGVVGRLLRLLIRP